MEKLFFVKTREEEQTELRNRGDEEGGVSGRSAAQSVVERPSGLGSVATWFRENKLRAVGAVWLGGVASGLAYNFSRPIPFQLKVIHSRVYAQAITLAALVGAAVVETTLLKKHEQQQQQQHSGFTASSAIIPHHPHTSSSPRP